MCFKVNIDNFRICPKDIPTSLVVPVEYEKRSYVGNLMYVKIVKSQLYRAMILNQ